MRDIARHKLVPVHSREIWYYTGGAVLFLFIVQFLTGIALAFYYVPYFEKAHESVVEIVTKLNMGWFFRSLHHWGAQAAIFVMFVHVFATLLLKSYRKPRELALDIRLFPPRHLHLLRPVRLFPPVGRAGLRRSARGNGRRGQPADLRRMDKSLPAGRHRRDRRDAHPLLRLPRLLLPFWCSP